MIKIVALKHEKQLDKSLFEEALSLVDEEQQKKILKLYRWQDRERSLLGNLLARSTLCSLFQIENQDLKINRGEMGKPYVEGIPQAYFNISHSGKWIVGAFDIFPVGIDVEYVKGFDYSMARKILDISDYEGMMQHREEERPHFFYRCWTLAESYWKMQGSGITLPLPSIKELQEKAYFKNYHLDEDHVLSLCATHNSFPKEVAISGTVLDLPGNMR